MIPFDWEEPDSLDAAISILASGDETVRPIAGGTALMLMMKAGVFAPSRLVSLAKIETRHSEIQRRTPTALHIGAMASLAQLEQRAARWPQAFPGHPPRAAHAFQCPCTECRARRRRARAWRSAYGFATAVRGAGRGRVDPRPDRHARTCRGRSLCSAITRRF